MDEQQHIKALESLCRVCGGLVNQNRPCQDQMDALYSVFNLDTTTDWPQIHPKSFCKRCFDVLQRANKAEEEESSCTQWNLYNFVTNVKEADHLKVGRGEEDQLFVPPQIRVPPQVQVRVIFKTLWRRL